MNKRVVLSALTLSLLLAACGGSPSPSAGVNDGLTIPAEADAQPDTVEPTYENVRTLSGHVHAVEPAPVLSNLPTDARLGPATVPRGGRLSAQALPANAQTHRVELKVLVLSSGTHNAGTDKVSIDHGIASAESMLQRSGVPYDVLDASQQTLDLSRLINADGSGKYQGVVLTSNALVAQTSPGVFVSTLDSDEWATLFQYEAAYGVRQLALYGYPGAVPEDYGLRAVPGAETSFTDMAPNPAGLGVFRDLKTSARLPVKHAFSYPSVVEVVPGVQNTTPLLLDAKNRVLAATSTAADGRERLLVTTAQNPALLHTELMGYGLVQWLTRGVHLGEHRRFLQVDIDDYFLAGDRLNAATGQLYTRPFRLSAADMVSVHYQQLKIRDAFKEAGGFRYAMVFNGGGANTAAPASCLLFLPSKDQLTSMSKCLKGQFDWVNHTKDHLRMDVMDLETASDQIATNFTLAARLGLPANSRSLVTGEHSGLGNMDPTDDGTYNDSDVNLPKQDLGLGRSNPNMLQAADGAGVRYLASDHSVASQWDASCSTCGVQHPLNSNLFLVPRWPINVHYHVTNPDEVLKSYNSIYAPGGTRPYWPAALNYTEFLDKESDLALTHMLGGGAFPHYLHQTNLNQYRLGKSVASDWVQAALGKYSRYSTLPLNTYTWDRLGDYLKSRTLEEKAKASGRLGAVWDRKTNTVTVRGAGPVTLTGANTGTAYGSVRILSSTVSGSAQHAVTPR